MASNQGGLFSHETHHQPYREATGNEEGDVAARVHKTLYVRAKPD